MSIALNDPSLPPVIQKNGGKFRCLLGIAEKVNSQNLCKEQMMKIYRIAGSMMDVMDTQCHCFKEDHRIIRMGFLSMHDKKSFARQVGYINYQEDLSNICEEDEMQSSLFIPKKFDFIIKEWLADNGQIYATLFNHKKEEISSFWNERYGPPPRFISWQNCSYYKVFYNHE